MEQKDKSVTACNQHVENDKELTDTAVLGFSKVNQRPGGSVGKKSHLHCGRGGRHGFIPWGGKIPCRRKQHFTPTCLPGKCYGCGRLEG